MIIIVDKSIMEFKIINEQYSFFIKILLVDERYGTSMIDKSPCSPSFTVMNKNQCYLIYLILQLIAMRYAVKIILIENV